MKRLWILVTIFVATISIFGGFSSPEKASAAITNADINAIITNTINSLSSIPNLTSGKPPNLYSNQLKIIADGIFASKNFTPYDEITITKLELEILVLGKYQTYLQET